MLSTWGLLAACCFYLEAEAAYRIDNAGNEWRDLNMIGFP